MKSNYRLNRERIGRLLADSNNYERIRYYAVNQFDRYDGPFSGISEKCKIIFNPFRHILITHSFDEGIEKYFDFELIDEDLPLDKARMYKKLFVRTFLYLLNNKGLNTFLPSLTISSVFAE